MTDPNRPAASIRQNAALPLYEIAPGLLLSATVAVAAVTVAPLVAHVFPVPAMVIALVIGIAFSSLAVRARFRAGTAFCVKTLLRWAVALLGLRIALGDIAALGLSTAAIVVGAMALTLLSGVLLARAVGQSDYYGALAGAGTAVCGASATLATATVLPAYQGKEADVVFVVVAVNALSTIAMVVYPLLCVALGMTPQETGVLLGGAIHDVAQVVGAGYAASNEVGDTAVIVKLFRVFLLLPVVLAIGYWLAAHGARKSQARAPAPVFAYIFLMLTVVNTFVPSLSPIAPAFEVIKGWLLGFSTWGLLIAIGALGLSTSVSGVAKLGWRHAATVTGTTIVVLAAVTAGLVMVR